MIRNAYSIPLLCVAAVAALFSLFFYFGPEDVVAALAKEDQFIESLSAIFFLAGAALCIVSFRCGRYRAMSALWLILCLFFFGEETSWLQRQIGYSVPEVEAINYQGEFNLHNLNIFHDKTRPFEETISSEGGGLAAVFKKMLHPQALFNSGFFAYFFVLPLLLWTGMFNFVERWIAIPRIDGWQLAAIWFSVGLTVAMSLSLDPSDERRHYMQELREMFFAGFIFLHIAMFSLQEMFADSETDAVDGHTAR